MKKKLLALLVCIISVMCMCVVSASAAGGSATFSDGKTLTWAQLKSSSNGTAYGYDASKITDTSIGEKAFYNNGYGCTKLVSIIIPDGVTSIGAYAFDGCTNLTSVTIPDSVTNIGAYAFCVCKGLTSITIPDSVTSIEAYAFRYCSGLTSATIGNGVTSVEEHAFDGCSSLTSITIPDSVMSIGDFAFNFCSGLTNIKIPDSVTSIGGRAFLYCSKLTSITIPDSVTNIGAYAFSSCNGLTSITIPDSVTSIGERAFSSCPSLTSITVSPRNIKYDSRNNCNAIIETATNTLIQGCNVSTIPDSVTNIGAYALYFCSKLTSVTIPDSVTNIGAYAFYICNGLTSITIPDSVTSIGESAFKSCSNLTSATFEKALVWIVTKDTTTATLSETNISNPATAANYLKDSYVSYTRQRPFISVSSSVACDAYADGTIVTHPIEIDSSILEVEDIGIEIYVSKVSVEPKNGWSIVSGPTYGAKQFSVSIGGQTVAQDSSGDYSVSFSKDESPIEDDGIPISVNLNFEANLGEGDFSDIADIIVLTTVGSQVYDYSAYTSKPSGTQIQAGISGLSAAEIKKCADAIAKNSSINNNVSVCYVDTGSGYYTISVGDQISWTMNGTSYPYRIMGFNHYDKADGTGKAGILFQMVDCFNTKYPMKSSMSSADGWDDSDLRTTLNSTLYGYLPSDVQSAISQVTIKTAQDVSTSTIITTNDKLFVPAEVEVFGSASLVIGGTNEGVWYPWYKANNNTSSRVKKVNGSANYWLERSPSFWNSNNGFSIFCNVSSNGNSNFNYADGSHGVAPCFCF